MRGKEVLQRAGRTTQEFISDHRREIIVAGAALTILATCLILSAVAFPEIARKVADISSFSISGLPSGIIVDVTGNCHPASLTTSLSGYEQTITRQVLSLSQGVQKFQLIVSCRP